MHTHTDFDVKTDIDVYNLFRDKFGDEAAQSLVEYLKSAIQKDAKAIVNEELVSFREKFNGEIDNKIVRECSALATKADLVQVEKNVEKSIAELEVRIGNEFKSQLRTTYIVGVGQFLAIVGTVLVIVKLMIK